MTLLVHRHFLYPDIMMKKTLARYYDHDIQDNGSEMGKELETTAKTFLGGVQIVRTRNQNIPDVSKLPDTLFVI